MKLVLQQGHWVDEQYQEWPNSYDVSTPELVNKFALPAFKLFLDAYKNSGKDLPDNKVYTLESYKETWTWRGGDDPNTTDPQKKSDWYNYYNSKKSFEQEQKKLNDVFAAFQAGDGQTVLQFLDGLDYEDICFQVINIQGEFVIPELFCEKEDSDA